MILDGAFLLPGAALSRRLFQTCDLSSNFKLLQYTAPVIRLTEVSMPATILLVEDEPAIQELIAANLMRAGHHVVRAADAETAQRIVGTLPDLILLDWMLPGMSGSRVCGV